MIDDRPRSNPWNRDEYVYYRGYQLVYDRPYGTQLFVHFPGGAVHEVGTLDRRQLVLPVKYRTHSF